MKRLLWLGLVLTGAATSIFQGCIFTPDVKEGVTIKDYKPQTSPENVVQNLQVSYRFREIEQYAKLLAPEFIFKVQPGDVLELGTDFYTRDEDSLGTHALFSTGEVADIKITLTYGASVLANDVELPDDTMKIRINQTELQVDETAGISWLVTDLQDMFFRPGREELGEDPAIWYLLEWRDIPTTQAPGLRPLAAETGTDGGSGMRTTTWGELLSRAQ